MDFKFSELKSNFAPGLVVFLVALPLCLGIALASGAPPLSGLIAGVIGGIVVGMISNSPISVSGPAAGLSAIVLAGITSLGSFELFLCAGLLAGIFQLILGFARAGSISNYFPNNVIEGMLAGIGIIIIRKQIPHALGYDADNMSTEETLFEHGFNLFDYLQTLRNSIHFGVIAIFIVSILILLLWDRYKLQSKMRLMPGALVAVLVSILIDEFAFKNITHLNVEQTHLVTLPIVDSWGTIKGLIRFPNWKGFAMGNVWVLGLTVAAVASIETLLCIEAADKMDKAKRITDTNLELKAQGIGNLLSSLIGGLPMTSVVVRSSANANAGASSKVSTVLHGLLLLICFLTFPHILNKIPLATLAAVLIMVGYKLAKPELFKKFWDKGVYQFLPFLITIIAVVLLDLLKGVALGMAISIVFILYENLKKSYYYSKEEIEGADEITLTLAEEVSFLNKAAIKNTLKNIAPNTALIIDASNSAYIASDVLELIEEFANFRAKEDNINVKLIGFETSQLKSMGDDRSHIKLTHRRTI